MRRGLTIILLAFSFVAPEFVPYAGLVVAPNPVCAHGCTGVCCCANSSEAASCEPAGFGREETSYSNCGGQQPQALVKLICDRIAPEIASIDFIPPHTRLLPLPSSQVFVEFIASPLDPPPWQLC